MNKRTKRIAFRGTLVLVNAFIVSYALHEIAQGAALGTYVLLGIALIATFLQALALGAELGRRDFG